MLENLEFNFKNVCVVYLGFGSIFMMCFSAALYLEIVVLQLVFNNM